MKLVVGLGNPGSRYADSRHNVGFRVVDVLAGRWGVELGRPDRRFAGYLGQVPVGGQPVLLLKPTTYMNLSGQSVAAVWRFYKLERTDVLVIYDDLDLPLGQLRVRASGTAGGHKGMDDVIRQLGSLEVARVRVGIGRVHPAAATAYVLSRFEQDEQPVVAEALERAAAAVECWLREGIVATMNRFNRRPAGESPDDRPAEGESS